MDIVTGEKVQLRTNHFLGTEEDFCFNPNINRCRDRCIDLRMFTIPLDNGPKIFCYSHRLDLLVTKMHLFKNPFTLYTGNSDGNFDPKYKCICDDTKVIEVFAQNVNMRHEKLKYLPIGIANSMWPHGNVSLFQSAMNTVKTIKTPYFYFSVDTCRDKRTDCKNKIEKFGLTFGNKALYGDYVGILARHEFAICPEGNGIDTHRLWECLYLKVVPICKRNILVEMVSDKFPVIILDDWSQLDLKSLDYSRTDWSNWNDLDLGNFCG